MQNYGISFGNELNSPRSGHLNFAFCIYHFTFDCYAADGITQQIVKEGEVLEEYLRSLSVDPAALTTQYIGFLRYAVPVLTFLLLLRCVWPLLTFRR